MPCINIPLRNKFYDMLFNLAYSAGLTAEQIIDCQVKIFPSSVVYTNCPLAPPVSYEYSVFKINTKCDYNYITHNYADAPCVVEGEGKGPWDGGTYDPNKTTIEYSVAYALADILIIMNDDCVGAGNWGSAELCGQANRQWICYKAGLWNADYEPPEPPEPEDPYEWESENNDIDCQAESFPAQSYEVYPSQLLDNLMNAICCSPRPCFLVCTNYNEELIAEPYAFSIQFRLELYFPEISGSIALLNGIPLVARCIGHQYFFVYSIADPLIDANEWQLNVMEFVEQFNFINQQKLKIMLDGYGINVQQQNEQANLIGAIDGVFTFVDRDNNSFTFLFNNSEPIDNDSETIQN